jgi:hypothetical protein
VLGVSTGWCSAPSCTGLGSARLVSGWGVVRGDSTLGPGGLSSLGLNWRCWGLLGPGGYASCAYTLMSYTSARVGAATVGIAHGLGIDVRRQIDVKARRPWLFWLELGALWRCEIGHGRGIVLCAWRTSTSSTTLPSSNVGAIWRLQRENSGKIETKLKGMWIECVTTRTKVVWLGKGSVCRGIED